MTTEDDFQAALDANPADWQTRLVFADWLQERNDPRAEGYRALGRLRLRPHPPARRKTDIQAWTWGSDRNPNNKPDSAWAKKYGMILLPGDWMKRVKSKHPDNAREVWKRFETRRAAENEAVAAFLRLSQKRRTEIAAAAPYPFEPKLDDDKKPPRRKPRPKTGS